MPTEDRWIDQPSILANAWSPLEIRARQRMAELLHEAEQDRLAGSARGLPRSGLQTWRSVALPTLLTATLSALVDFARRLVRRASRPVAWSRLRPADRRGRRAGDGGGVR
jgi:hypothetical protein